MKKTNVFYDRLILSKDGVAAEAAAPSQREEEIPWLTESAAKTVFMAIMIVVLNLSAQTRVATYGVITKIAGLALAEDAQITSQKNK